MYFHKLHSQEMAEQQWQWLPDKSRSTYTDLPLWLWFIASVVLMCRRTFASCLLCYAMHTECLIGWPWWERRAECAGVCAKEREREIAGAGARVAILWNNYVWTLVKYELVVVRSPYDRQPFVCPSQVTTELPRHLHFLSSVNRFGLSTVSAAQWKRANFIAQKPLQRTTSSQTTPENVLPSLDCIRAIVQKPTARR